MHACNPFFHLSLSLPLSLSKHITNMDVNYKIPDSIKQQIISASEEFEVLKQQSITNTLPILLSRSNNNDSEENIRELRDTLASYRQVYNKINDSFIINCDIELYKLTEFETQNGDIKKVISPFIETCEGDYEIKHRLDSFRVKLDNEQVILSKISVFEDEQKHQTNSRYSKSSFINGYTRDEKQKQFFKEIYDLVFNRFEGRIHTFFLESLQRPIVNIIHSFESKIKEDENKAKNDPDSNPVVDVYKQLKDNSAEALQMVGEIWTDVKEMGNDASEKAKSLYKEATDVFESAKQTTNDVSLSLSSAYKRLIARSINKTDPDKPPIAVQINQHSCTIQVLDGEQLTSSFGLFDDDIKNDNLSIIKKDSNTVALVSKNKDGILKGLIIRVLRDKFVAAESTIKSWFMKPLKKGESAYIITAGVTSSLKGFKPISTRKHITSATMLALILVGINNVHYGDTPYPEHGPLTEPLFPDLVSYSTNTDTNFYYPTSTPDQAPPPLPPPPRRLPPLLQQQPEERQLVDTTSTFRFQELAGVELTGQSLDGNIHRTIFLSILQQEREWNRNVTEYQFAFEREEDMLFTDVKYNGKVITLWFDYNKSIFFNSRICIVDALPPSDIDLSEDRKQQQQQQQRNTINTLGSIKGILSALTTWGEINPQTGDFVELEYEEMAKRAATFMTKMTIAYAATKAMGPTKISGAAGAGLVYAFTTGLPELASQSGATSYINRFASYGDDDDNKKGKIGLKPQSDYSILEKQTDFYHKKGQTTTTTTTAVDKERSDFVELINAFEEVFQYCLDVSEKVTVFDELRYEIEPLKL